MAWVASMRPNESCSKNIASNANLGQVAAWAYEGPCRPRKHPQALQRGP